MTDDAYAVTLRAW